MKDVGVGELVTTLGALGGNVLLGFRLPPGTLDPSGLKADRRSVVLRRHPLLVVAGPVKGEQLVLSIDGTLAWARVVSGVGAEDAG